jgi:Holliday junction resolvasome RuvABC endonuclease subunit
VHTVAYDKGYRVEQIGATTVQAKIAIRGKGKKITKPQVRNGVINLLPTLKDKAAEWIKEFDEPDAIAIALAHLGFKNKSIKRG